VEEKPYQCENRMGFLEASLHSLRSHSAENRASGVHLPGRKNLPVHHLLERVQRRPVRRARNYAAAFLLPLAILSSIYAPLVGLTQVLPTAIAILAPLTSLCLSLDKKDMAASLHSLFDSTHQLVSQIEMNHNNAVLTSEIGQSISRRSGSVDVLSNVVKACKEVARLRPLHDPAGGQWKKRLVFGAGFGHDERQLKLLRQTAFHLDKPGSRGVFVSVSRSRSRFW
jgi:hypothetical protein